MSVSSWVADDFGWGDHSGVAVHFLGYSSSFLASPKFAARVIDTLKLLLAILGVDFVGDIDRAVPPARWARRCRRAFRFSDRHQKASCQTVGNVVLKEGVAKGASMRSARANRLLGRGAAKVCDSIVSNMIDPGEETIDLDKMLMKNRRQL